MLISDTSLQKPLEVFPISVKLSNTIKRNLTTCVYLQTASIIFLRRYNLRMHKNNNVKYRISIKSTGCKSSPQAIYRWFSILRSSSSQKFNKFLQQNKSKIQVNNRNLHVTLFFISRLIALNCIHNFNLLPVSVTGKEACDHQERKARERGGDQSRRQCHRILTTVWSVEWSISSDKRKRRGRPKTWKKKTEKMMEMIQTSPRLSSQILQTRG